MIKFRRVNARGAGSSAQRKAAAERALAEGDRQIQADALADQERRRVAAAAMWDRVHGSLGWTN